MIFVIGFLPFANCSYYFWFIFKCRIVDCMSL